MSYKVNVVIGKKINRLSPELQQEVVSFIDFLLSKDQPNKIAKKKFSFNWAGKLSDMKDKFTSVELQHKALEWW